MSVPEDQLAALRQRDPDALRQAADLYARRLYRAARGMGVYADEAEDLVQEVFVTFVATLDRFEGRSSLLTWLFGILLRKVQERRRARAREARHESLDEEWSGHFTETGQWVRRPADPIRGLDNQQLSIAIEECLEDLTDRQRDVFMLRLVEELPAAEVSNVLGLTVTNVGVVLHRARLLMRKCLGLRGQGTVPS